MPEPWEVTERGGREPNTRSTVTGDLWRWNLATNTWHFSTPYLPDGEINPRWNMAYTTFKDTMLIHGGYVGPKYRDDMWELNTTTYSWIKVSYEHRNQLIFDPKPVPRAGHSMTVTGNGILFFGGFSTRCEDVDQGSDVSANPICIPKEIDQVPMPFVKDENGDSLTEPHEFSWSEPDPWVQARLQEGEIEPSHDSWINIFFAETWLFMHEECPESCHGQGTCNLGFCLCDQSNGAGRWGYHCGYEMCHNSTCRWNYTRQTELCMHCHHHGFCNGHTGRCHCNPAYQHILPIHYDETAISPHGAGAHLWTDNKDMVNFHGNLTIEKENGTLNGLIQNGVDFTDGKWVRDGAQYSAIGVAVTNEPVPMYAVNEQFQDDERRRKDCLWLRCPHHFCSGHGYCMPTGVCHCHPEFVGTGCEYHAYCSSQCNFQGICENKLRDPTMPWVSSLAGDCVCHDVFNGTSCRTATRNYAVSSRSYSVIVIMVALVSTLIATHGY